MSEDHPRWGRHRGTVPWPQSEPLDDAAVSVLRDGRRIIIHWSGGNGPHEYIVTKIGDRLYARTTFDDEQFFRDHMYQWRDTLYPPFITTYGAERWQTKVWYADR